MASCWRNCVFFYIPWRDLIPPCLILLWINNFDSTSSKFSLDNFFASSATIIHADTTDKYQPLKFFLHRITSTHPESFQNCIAFLLSLSFSVSLSYCFQDMHDLFFHHTILNGFFFLTKKFMLMLGSYNRNRCFFLLDASIVSFSFFPILLFFSSFISCFTRTCCFLVL